MNISPHFVNFSMFLLFFCEGYAKFSIFLHIKSHTKHLVPEAIEGKDLGPKFFLGMVWGVTDGLTRGVIFRIPFLTLRDGPYRASLSLHSLGAWVHAGLILSLLWSSPPFYGNTLDYKANFRSLVLELFENKAELWEFQNLRLWTNL